MTTPSQVYRRILCSIGLHRYRRIGTGKHAIEIRQEGATPYTVRVETTLDGCRDCIAKRSRFDTGVMRGEADSFIDASEWTRRVVSLPRDSWR